MSKPNLKRPPLSDREKESLAEQFLEGAARSSPQEKKEVKKKRGILFMRIPGTLEEDLERLEDLTGYKKNAFCLHAIVEAVREKLKQIERDK